MAKRTIRLTESKLMAIVKEGVKRMLMAENYMSDEDIENQYKDMIITHFNIKPLRNSDEGWSGMFELEFPNADDVDFDSTMVNNFIVYDNNGDRIAWDNWMPDEQTDYLQEIIRNEISKRQKNM